SGSLLVADVGGALYYSDLKIYDLVGLTNPEFAAIVRTDRVALHNYIFEEVQPTFITIAASWAHLVHLDSDPRFREDYRPICEEIDRWIKNYHGQNIYAGDYVRKEHIKDETSLLTLPVYQCVLR
ncbi:MAG: hypothetical protein AAF639_01245, partial [Chloroflexota bacterium]